MPLTDEQLQALSTKRKSRPPSYFSADSGGSIPVSGDVEDALILASPEAKAKAIAYIQLILNANNGSSDFATLLTEYTEKQTANAKATKDAYDALLQKFGEFKDGLTRGADTTTLRNGMDPLIKALNRGIGTITSLQKSADFRYDYEQASSEYFNKKVTEGQKKELRSWVRVLAIYR